MIVRVVYNIDDRIKMQLAMVYTLIEKGKYARPKVYQIEEIIKSDIFEDVFIS